MGNYCWKCGEKMSNYNEAECQEFYEIAKKRMQKDYSESAIFDGKPEGFSDWLKDTWPERRKQKSKIVIEPLYTCWKCNKKYGGSKCPVCGAFKPRE